MVSNFANGDTLVTRVLPVINKDLGQFDNQKTLETWQLSSAPASLAALQTAAAHLRDTIIPVAFPTETVYGLGADATRSDAVKGIYKAKGRPSDNPLIVHICDLTMLRSLVTSPETSGNKNQADVIPAIYKPLIARFWPGPLTILLPNPQGSKLAPEVTAGLPTFGVRMPESPLALSLICLAGVPIAAPSANASTKPSPTTAQHVLHDLKGRVEIILDGGPCQVGVESTVVDGMSNPPIVLRPGGISIDRIRECEGWSGVVKGYKDHSEVGTHAPRAPGMKYKHYSPKAKVVLYEAGSGKSARHTGIQDEIFGIVAARDNKTPYLGLESLQWPIKIGIVSTKNWTSWGGFHNSESSKEGDFIKIWTFVENQRQEASQSFPMQEAVLVQGLMNRQTLANVTEISLGKDTKDIAHGLFSALRELDLRGIDIIYVEGIEDEEDIGAAVMNRLRKAATVIRQ